MHFIKMHDTDQKEHAVQRNRLPSTFQINRTFLWIKYTVKVSQGYVEPINLLFFLFFLYRDRSRVTPLTMLSDLISHFLAQPPPLEAFYYNGNIF